MSLNSRDLKTETNKSVLKKLYKIKISHKTDKCDICPWHDGENRKRRPKDDRYKNKRG